MAAEAAAYHRPSHSRLKLLRKARAKRPLPLKVAATSRKTMMSRTSIAKKPTVRPFTLVHVLIVREEIVLLMVEAAVAADAGVVDGADVPEAEAATVAHVVAEAVAKLEE